MRTLIGRVTATQWGDLVRDLVVFKMDPRALESEARKALTAPTAPAIRTGLTSASRIFTVEGLTLKVRPVDNTALELNYYQKISRAIGGCQLAVQHTPRHLPVRVAGRNLPVCAGERDIGAPVEGTPRRNLRRDREAQQQDLRRGRHPCHGASRPNGRSRPFVAG